MLIFAKKRMNMKRFFYFCPIILFFIVYKLFDIYLATIVAIITSILQLGVFWLRFRRWEVMQIVALVAIIIFGGATILFRDDLFIKLKPTVVTCLVGFTFLWSHFFGECPLVKRFVGKNIDLTNQQWKNLNLMWAFFFIGEGVINIIVVFSVGTAMWVNFKVFGILGLTLLFGILQSIYISKHLRSSE